MRVAALLLVCVALAACGASSKPAASTGPAGSTSTAGARAASSGAPTSSTPASSGPTATAPPPATGSGSATTPAGATTTGPQPVDLLPCTASKLTLSVLSSQGAAGHAVIALGLRNISPRPCHTYGFPGVAFLGAGGGVMNITPARVTTDFAGTVEERAIRLPAGESASFRLVISHVGSGPTVCGTASALQVIPPDDTASLHVTLSGGTTVCDKVTVSPVAPGESANP